MKILIIHNKYGKFSGEESVVESQINLLKSEGHDVISYFRSSEELEKMPLSKIRAFISGIHNPKSIRDIGRLISVENPDIVHIHNLYPLISPAILPVIKKMGVPIVMTVHNYRLVCPNGLFYSNGAICEKCTGKNKELNCVLNNCEGSVFKSSGYAIRNYWSRYKNYYSDNINKYLCLSKIQFNKLVQNGYDKNKIQIIPNMYGGDLSKEKIYKEGTFIGYVGRISKEKGSEILFEIAKELPEIKFKIVGSLSNKENKFDSLENVEYLGFMNKERLGEFYNNCLFTIFTSVWNETFGLTLIESLAHMKPVIASDLGASPEIIKNQEFGIIYKNKNVEDLVRKVRELNGNKILIKEMGEKGYQEVKKKYSKKVYFESLMSVYNKLI